MHIPQLIILALYAINFGITLAKSGEPLEGTYNPVSTFITTILIIGLLKWGGFF